MARTTDNELLQRFHDFEISLDLGVAERVEELGNGVVALLSPGIPLVWDSNLLLVEEAALTGSEIAALADEVLGGLGMKHRYVVIRRPAVAEGLEAEFTGLGWDVDRTLNMVLRREPDRQPQAAVEQVDLESAWPTRIAFSERDPNATPQTNLELLEHSRRVAAFYRDRWFAAQLDGDPASACRLIQHDGIGQVEDVATLPAARNRGLARAVVLAAAQTSREDGDQLTFITADATDWPLRLYERLGFDPVGVSLAFRLRPGSD